VNHSGVFAITIRLLALLFATGLAFGRVACADEADDVAAAKAKTWKPIDTGAFADSIHHAAMKYKDGTAPYPRHAPEQIVHIAENLLAYQNGDGGWPKNVDWLKVLSPEEAAALPHGRAGGARPLRYLLETVSGDTSTLDNSTTWSQSDYLARVYEETRLRRFADAVLKGIDYLLREQRPSGGWRGADVDAITFNDDVMAGTLRTLKAVANDARLFGFVDDERRAAARKAFDNGIRCILKCQIVVDGRLTAWCQQHSHEDFQPVWARTFEPPSITAGESVDVVRLLMEIENPPPEIVRAIQAAVAWFDKVKIAGLRIEKVPAEPVQFKYHYSDYDCVEVKDPAAPPIWTRYHDLKTEVPIFCTRERKITHNYADVGRERRTGYAWYGAWPAKLIATEYPAWQRRRGSEQSDAREH
jgi:PelA/Pel-15E family pectate lyase